MTLATPSSASDAATAARDERITSPSTTRRARGQKRERPGAFSFRGREGCPAFPACFSWLDRQVSNSQFTACSRGRPGSARRRAARVPRRPARDDPRRPPPGARGTITGDEHRTGRAQRRGRPGLVVGRRHPGRGDGPALPGRAGEDRRHRRRRAARRTRRSVSSKLGAGVGTVAGGPPRGRGPHRGLDADPMLAARF